MSVHAAGLTEPGSNYVWENLSANSFLKGAAQSFPREKRNGSLKEYAIAGVMYLDHLAGLKTSELAQQTLKLRASQLAVVLGTKEEYVQIRINTLLENHRKEWENFLDSLGPQSFLKMWAAQRAA
jgi:hypothetical protein